MVLSMYVGYPSRFEAYGAVKIYELSKVQVLLGVGGSSKPGLYSIANFDEFIKTAESTAIVVPTRDEDPMVLEGVLRAVPIYSPLIVVSASTQKPLNVYGMEMDIAKTLYRVTGRPTIVIHQRDPILADILKDSIPNIIDEDGLIRYGKGEALLIATLVADGIGVENIGFIDADNYIPGAVTEYALIYYTVLRMGESDYKMVRVSWGYKAYGSVEFYLRKTGKASQIVNSVLNKVLSFRRRIETEIIKTSNSGEHAMSMKLAKELTYAGGYAVETQELVSILEMCYIDVDTGRCPSLPHSIEIYQVESRNPHIHSEKGETHVVEMIIDSLSTIYHSKLGNDSKTRSHIINILRELAYESEPPLPQIYKYPDINTRAFLDKLLSESRLCVAYGL